IPLITGLTRKTSECRGMGLVTAFCSLTTTGADEAVVQATGESRFVVNCKVNPAALLSHVKTTLSPEGMILGRHDSQLHFSITRHAPASRSCRKLRPEC